MQINLFDNDTTAVEAERKGFHLPRRLRCLDEPRSMLNEQTVQELELLRQRV